MVTSCSRRRSTFTAAASLVTELEGLPNALDLNRNLNENLVKLLEGDQDVDQTTEALQAYWAPILK